MRLSVDLKNVARVDMRVALRRGEAGVAQKLLDGTEIGPALQQVGGEAVAQACGG